MVSTTVETENPEAELKPGLDVLEPIENKYVHFYKHYKRHFLAPDGNQTPNLLTLV